VPWYWEGFSWLVHRERLLSGRCLPPSPLTQEALLPSSLFVPAHPDAGVLAGKPDSCPQGYFWTLGASRESAIVEGATRCSRWMFMNKGGQRLLGEGTKPDPAKRVLEFLRDYFAENLRPPTIREIQDHLGYRSPRAVSYLLEKLERKGEITRRPRARGVLPRDAAYAPRAAVEIPLYPSIPAGLPDRSSCETRAEGVWMDPSLVGIEDPSRAFAVVVRGQSMIGAGIQEGDIIIFESRQPKEGDIVAALVDGESTLKRLVRRQGRYCLASENPAYPSLYPMEELSIQGVAVAVIRRLT
jgi:repressor LexA